ncbi:AbiU2 domain-containing protein [Pseudomonas monsensis]
MTTRNSEEILAHYLRTMGDPLGTAFWHLNQQILELHLVWEQYTQLFGEGEETVNLLNRTAGLFFKVVQDELWDSVLLGVSKLTDPAQTGKNKNLSIRSLPDLIADSVLRGRVLDLCDEALKKAEHARDHRNKRIAHQDQRYFYNREAHSLGGVSRTLVREMLQAITAVMNEINVFYTDTTMFYDEISSGGDAAWLVHKLKSMA